MFDTDQGESLDKRAILESREVETQMEEYYEAALDRIDAWGEAGGVSVSNLLFLSSAIHAEFKSMVAVARKQMARELLDEIKYSGNGGDDDSWDLSMVTQRLMEVEQNG